MFNTFFIFSRSYVVTPEPLSLAIASVILISDSVSSVLFSFDLMLSLLLFEEVLVRLDAFVFDLFDVFDVFDGFDVLAQNDLVILLFSFEVYKVGL